MLNLDSNCTVYRLASFLSKLNSSWKIFSIFLQILFRIFGISFPFSSSFTLMREFSLFCLRLFIKANLSASLFFCVTWFGFFMEEHELFKLFEFVELEWWWSWVCGIFPGTAKLGFFLKMLSLLLLWFGVSIFVGREKIPSSMSLNWTNDFLLSTSSSFILICDLGAGIWGFWYEFIALMLWVCKVLIEGDVFPLSNLIDEPCMVELFIGILLNDCGCTN